MTERTIRRKLERLVEKKILLRGNYNKSGYDRTFWYSMPEFAIGQNGQSNGQSDQPIPDIEPDIEPVNTCASDDARVAQGQKNQPLNGKTEAMESCFDEIW